ncbi:MAG: hypothetical protein IAE89_02480 [Anaerolineae bacterium]|nr:hypothetical protein [Anaerolineae bacterium]
MTDLLFSYLVRDSTSDPYGQRLYDDGKVESYRVSRLVKSASGAYQEQPVTPGWYPAATLNEDQLAQSRAAIEASGVRGMPAKVTGSANNTSDLASGEIEVMTGDGLHKMTVKPWYPGGDTGRRLFHLISQLNNLITQSLA